MNTNIPIVLFQNHSSAYPAAIISFSLSAIAIVGFIFLIHFVIRVFQVRNNIQERYGLWMPIRDVEYLMDKSKGSYRSALLRNGKTIRYDKKQRRSVISS